MTRRDYAALLVFPALLSEQDRGRPPERTRKHRPPPPLERLRDQARELPRCPFCDVAAGWPCVDADGVERAPHGGRA